MAVVGSWVAAAFLGTSVAAATATATGMFIAGVVNAALGLAVNMILAKVNAPEGPRPQQVTTENRASNAKRMRHLGRVRASGTVVFYEWANIATTRRLFKLIAVADGGMTNVVRFYLNGDPVNVDTDGYVTTEPWNKGNIRLRWRSGIAGEPDYDGGLWGDMQSAFPGYWTADHRLRGIGTILATFDAVDGDEIPEVYPGGEPQVSALINGAPAFWVASEDSANSREPARQLSDILLQPFYGCLTVDDLNEASFIEARNVGNEEVTTAGGTRPKYLSGISYSLADPIKDVAQKLIDAMGGRAWIGLEGKFNIQAGKWYAPAVTIEERHIVEMDYSSGTNRINRVTSLLPSYVAPEIRWQETTADEWEDTEAITLWGEGEPKGIDLLAVQHHGQARHICKQKIALMNPRRKMKLKLRSFGLRLLGEQNVYVNVPRIGVNNSPFWVDSWSFDGTNTVVELSQADPESFQFGAGQEGEPPSEVEEFDREELVFSTDIDSLVVVTDDGVPYIRVQGSVFASWGFIGMMQYRRTGAAEWTDGIRETAPAGSYRYRTNPLKDGGTYQVRTYITSAAQSWKQRSTPVVVTDIDVVVNNTPPDPPVVISESGAAGGTLVVEFEPDLGVNYDRTELWRSNAGGVFGDAIYIKQTYSKASVVTLTAPIPGAGARFYLVSYNTSNRDSTPTVVGNYP